MGTIEAVVVGDKWYNVTGPMGLKTRRILAGSSFEARRIVARIFPAADFTDFYAVLCPACDCSPVVVNGDRVHSLTCATFDGMPLGGWPK